MGPPPQRFSPPFPAAPPHPAPDCAATALATGDNDPNPGQGGGAPDPSGEGDAGSAEGEGHAPSTSPRTSPGTSPGASPAPAPGGPRTEPVLGHYALEVYDLCKSATLHDVWAWIDLLAKWKDLEEHAASPDETRLLEAALDATRGHANPLVSEPTCDLSLPEQEAFIAIKCAKRCLARRPPEVDSDPPKNQHRGVCATPGCTRLDFHYGAHSNETPLGAKRTRKTPVYDESAKLVADAIKCAKRCLARRPPEVDSDPPKNQHRGVCATPGCTRLDFHYGAHSNETPLGAKRTRKTPVYDESAKLVADADLAVDRDVDGHTCKNRRAIVCAQQLASPKGTASDCVFTLDPAFIASVNPGDLPNMGEVLGARMIRDALGFDTDEYSDMQGLRSFFDKSKREDPKLERFGQFLSNQLGRSGVDVRERSEYFAFLAHDIDRALFALSERAQ